MDTLLNTATKKAQAWLNSSIIDRESKQAIEGLLNYSNTKLLIDSFYKELEFGTGGLRGIMGVG